jgi:hypothetical protein
VSSYEVAADRRRLRAWILEVLSDLRKSMV